MKRKTTKEILAESFRELAESKSVDRITVQESVDNCDYSTATFYRHFKDKYDLIAWNYARKTAEIMGRINGKDYSWTQTLRDGAEHYSEEKEYLANLLLHLFIRHKGGYPMEKYIPYEKLSKKKKRELDAGRRTVWAISPVTRKSENPKAYNRRKAQKRMDDPSSVLSFFGLRLPKGR